MTPAPRRRFSAAIVLIGTCLIALTALGLLVLTSARLQQLDNEVRSWVFAHQMSLVAYGLRMITNFGNALAVVPVFLLLAGGLSRLRGTAEPLVAALTASGLLTVSVVLLKAVVGRQGPRSEPPGMLSGAWPSGHTATATVVYGLLALLVRSHVELRPSGMHRYGIPALLALPILVAISLVYCDYHWISDVAGGFLLGLPIVVATHLLTRRLFRPPDALRPSARPTASQNRS